MNDADQQRAYVDMFNRLADTATQRGTDAEYVGDELDFWLNVIHSAGYAVVPRKQT